MTKIFVSALVLQLVAEGLLDLDGDAAPFAEGITIRQLLNHTSGLPDFIDDIVAFFEPYRRNPATAGRSGPAINSRWSWRSRARSRPGRGGRITAATTSCWGSSSRRRRADTPRGAAATHPGAARSGRTDLVEGPLRGDCARGYLPPDNPLLPGGAEPVDVTAIDVPFHQAGGGVVSTAGEIAKMLRAQLRGELLPDRLRKEMLRAVESDWDETDRYGLGVGEITALMGRQRSPCGAAWGHLGFSVGYTAVALSSEDGERQVVICANGGLTTVETDGAFCDAAGRLAWHLYCR